MVHKPLPAPQVPAARAQPGKHQIRAAFSLTSFACSPDGWPRWEKRHQGNFVSAPSCPYVPRLSWSPLFLAEPLCQSPFSSQCRYQFPGRQQAAQRWHSRVPAPALGSPAFSPACRGSPLVYLWPEASGQSRNPTHGQLAAGRSFTNSVAPEETDNLFHLQPSAAKDRVPAELVQSQGSLL